MPTKRFLILFPILALAACQAPGSFNLGTWDWGDGGGCCGAGSPPLSGLWFPQLGDTLLVGTTEALTLYAYTDPAFPVTLSSSDSSVLSVQVTDSTRPHMLLQLHALKVGRVVLSAKTVNYAAGTEILIREP
jgi:hypothetical protein